MKLLITWRDHQLCWLSYCFAVAVQVDFRQSFGGSLSITAQCIETQLMPNERSGKDLQIMCGHCYVRSLLHGVNCITKYQRPSNCFSCGFCFFLLLSTFGKNVRKFLQRNCWWDLSETSHVCSWVDCGKFLQNVVDLHKWPWLSSSWPCKFTFWVISQLLRQLPANVNIR